jgi:hypothetical protein
MRTPRKTTPKVKDGKVQKKNRHDLTPNYWNTRQDKLQLDVRKPGKGYKHFLKKRDIVKFLQLLPNWEELNIELDAIILASGGGADGWYSNGVIAICAWEKEKTVSLHKSYYEDHKSIFDRLNIRCEVKASGVVCHFTEPQIIAYQLLHILLHEFGHHHDRVSTKDKIDNAPRGENYAEAYAFKYEKIIWTRFFEEFQMT